MSTRPPVLPALPSHALVPASGAPSLIVATLDPDGRPTTTFMTWVAVLDDRTLRMCVDTRSRTYENLVARPAVGVELLADGLVWGLKGTARVAKAVMASTPFPCALVEIVVDEARDHGAAGTRLRGPTYAYDEDKGHRREVEQRMFAELVGPIAS